MTVEDLSELEAIKHESVNDLVKYLKGHWTHRATVRYDGSVEISSVRNSPDDDIRMTLHDGKVVWGGYDVYGDWEDTVLGHSLEEVVEKLQRYVNELWEEEEEEDRRYYTNARKIDVMCKSVKDLRYPVGWKESQKRMELEDLSHNINRLREILAKEEARYEEVKNA